MNIMNDDFYGSIDRLIEFGLSGRLANAMIQTMNEAMANMQMPNYSYNNKIDMINQVAVAPVSQKKFFVVLEQNPIGPLDNEELRQKISMGKVMRDTLIWYKGLPGWVEAKKLEEICLMFNNVPPTFSEEPSQK